MWATIKCEECGATTAGRVNDDRFDTGAMEITAICDDWTGGREDCKHEGQLAVIDWDDEDD
jgi:hypothetical protein